MTQIFTKSFYISFIVSLSVKLETLNFVSTSNTFRIVLVLSVMRSKDTSKLEMQVSLGGLTCNRCGVSPWFWQTSKDLNIFSRSSRSWAVYLLSTSHFIRAKSLCGSGWLK